MVSTRPCRAYSVQMALAVSMTWRRSAETFLVSYWVMAMVSALRVCAVQDPLLGSGQVDLVRPATVDAVHLVVAHAQDVAELVDHRGVVVHRRRVEVDGAV